MIADYRPFAKIDAAARRLRIPEPRTYKGVADAIREIAPTPLERARAAYIWLAENMIYDENMVVSGKFEANLQTLLTTLRGDCGGHSKVYAELCKSLEIECVVVAGYRRGLALADSIFTPYARPAGEGQTWNSHVWNALRIDGKWGLADVTDANNKRIRGTKVRKEGTTDEYAFFPDPALVATERLPNDPKWQLLAESITQAEALRLPLIRPVAIRFGLTAASFEYTRASAGSLQVLTFSAISSRELRAHLDAQGRDAKNRAIAQVAGTGQEVLVAPLAGHSALWLSVQLGHTGNWINLAALPIQSESDAPVLPQATTLFFQNGCRLRGPFEGHLRAGESYRFSVDLPEGGTVGAFADRQVFPLVKSGKTYDIEGNAPRGEIHISLMVNRQGRYATLLLFASE